MARNAIADEDWAKYSAEVGRKLHRLRIAKGMSQEDLAYAAGLSRYTYQKFEKGESRPGEPANPHLRTIAALAGALDTPLAHLLPEWVPLVRI
ncbi:MAG: XRE family transcriptional regulator [Salinibacterium sp.]|nr:MAG: XRE family transcriptional regulator [Salinibacterium sp.]